MTVESVFLRWDKFNKGIIGNGAFMVIFLFLNGPFLSYYNLFITQIKRYKGTAV